MLQDVPRRNFHHEVFIEIRPLPNTVQRIQFLFLFLSFPHEIVIASELFHLLLTTKCVFNLSLLRPSNLLLATPCCRVFLELTPRPARGSASISPLVSSFLNQLTFLDTPTSTNSYFYWQPHKLRRVCRLTRSTMAWINRNSFIVHPNIVRNDK